MARNFVQSTDWVDNVTKYIAEESGARQAMFITRLAGNKGINYRASPIIDEVFVKLGQKFPIITTNITDDQDKPTTSCSDAAGPIPLSSTQTFFILIHDFRDAGTILPSTSFIDAVAEMASFDYHPRYLILSVAPVLSGSLEELLQYAWTKNMLDLTILQWVEETVSRHLLKTESCEFSLPIVHQLNPFKQEYNRNNWSSNSGGLFPNKVDNMAGHPLRALVSDSPPFSVSAFNEFDEPLFVDGANVRLLQLIAQKLNASLKYIRRKFPKEKNIEASDFHTHYYILGERSKLDISAYLHARVSLSKCSSLLTTMVKVDELCAVVPILSRSARFESKHVLAAFLCSFSIVVIYWIVARVLRLSVRVWRPFTIVRVFFSVSVSLQLRRTVERVMLTSLLAISSIYSSRFYSALTDISLFTTSEVVFESITDLDNSGLIPLVSPLYFNRTFHGGKGALKNLMDKSIVSLDGVDSCIQQLVQHKNVTCFMDKSRAEVLIARSRINGQPMMKLAKPCFWTDAAALDLGKRSPYRSSIDVVISRMQNAGLIKKLYEDAKYEMVERHKEEDVRVLEKQQSMIALRHQFLTLAISCYTISLLVFIGEIVVHRVSKYIRSKRQAIVHFPYTE